ncbi:Glutathione S-transferase omega-1, partial [Halocaridina rubra]
MKYCPYAQRTRLVLQAKNVGHEIVNIDLQEKPEWYSEKNPLMKVPTLEHDGKFMYESLVTCDYLDEAYPEPPLHPKDPWQKGKDRCLLELFGKVTSAMYRVYRAHVKNEEEEIAKAFSDIKEGLIPFETELQLRGTEFFDGETPGMLDYMLWPFGERLPVVELMTSKDLPQNQFSLM